MLQSTLQAELYIYPTERVRRVLSHYSLRFSASVFLAALHVLPGSFALAGSSANLQASYAGAPLGYFGGDTTDDVDSIPGGARERHEMTGRVESLGPRVNTDRSEFGPVIAPDGRTLYFTRYSRAGDQDIWYSKLGSGGVWEVPSIMEPPLTNSSHNFIESVTPDGNTLLLGGGYDDVGKSARQLSVSHRTSTGWSFPEELKIRNYYSTTRSVSNYLCNDGRTLLMSLERKEGAGAQDLYVSFRGADGEWSEPMSLGGSVNTAESEFAPFLAADGISLYFSSKGHGGYGDADLFVSRRLDSSWQNWSAPENLGPEINTTGWDGYYVIPASGEYAYFASSAGSIGGSDIVRIGLPESVRPRPVTLVSGRVLDPQGKPVDALVHYEAVGDGMSEGKESGTARTDPSTGEYKIILPAHLRYAIRAEASGYIASSEALDATERKSYTEQSLDLKLAPIEVGESVAMRNIFFEFGQERLQTESFPELERLLRLMNDQPTMTIEIGGHTDHVGSEASNMRMSLARACAVAAYLMDRGIAIERLSVHGYGESKPIAGEDSEEECERNRRVEFTITGR